MSISTAAATRLRKVHWVWLIIILSGGTLLRFYKIAKPNMWLDEIWTLELSIGRDSVHDHLPLGLVQHKQIDMTELSNAPPWWSIWNHLADCAQPPVYQIVLRLWMDIFGNGTGAARSLSALFSTLALLVFFDICRLVHRPTIALLATALSAIAVGQIDYAQQTRSYSLLILIALAAGDLVLRIERSGPDVWRVGPLVVTLAAAELTHYFAAGAILALGIYAVIRLRGRTRWITLAAFPAAVIIFLLAWGPQYVVQHRTQDLHNFGFVSDPQGGIFLTLERIVALPAKLLLGEERLLTLDGSWLAFGGLVIWVLPLMLWKFGRRDLAFWSVWTLGNVAFIAAIDVTQHTRLMAFSRYPLLAAPGLCAMAVSYSFPPWPPLRHALAVATIALVSIFTFQRARDGFPDIGNMHEMALAIDSSVPADGLVVFYSDDPLATPGCWYLGWRYYSPKSQRDWMALMRPADESVAEQILPRREFWVVGKVDSPVWPAIFPGWHETDHQVLSAGSISRLVRDGGGTNP